ncbi:MAG: sigma-70 family RNA polymerase sigma factor [Chloroflexota bacterium]
MEPAELTLIEQARRGDAEALAAIVRSRMDAVYRLALAIAGDDADAADIVQDSFVAAWRQLPHLRDVVRFDAWLHRIVVNTARMAVRGRRRRRVREIPDEAFVSTASIEARPMPSDGSRLAAALGYLDADQRALLALHHLEGRGLDEIAAILEVPVGTVKSRLYAARRALETALAREDGR